MKKVLLLSIFFCLTGSAFAQSTTSSISSTSTTSATTSTTTTTSSTASVEEAKKKVEELPIHLTLYNELSTQVDDIQNNGLSNSLYILPTYSINKNWSVGLSTQVDQSIDLETGLVENSFNRTYLNVFRRGLLSQEKHGLNLTGHLRLQGYYHNASNDGYGLLGMNFSRSFGNNFSVYFINRYVAYAKKSGPLGGGQGYWLEILGATYSFNDKWSAGIETYYLFLSKKGDGKVNEGKRIYAHEESFLTLSASYQATSQLSIGTYLANYMTVAHNGAVELDTFFDNAYFSVNATYSVF